MLFDPLLELFSSSPARGYGEDLGFSLVDSGREFEAIQHENSLGRSVANSLVSVDEGMIHDQGKTQGRSLGRKARVKILTAERLSGLAKCGLQHSEIPQSGGATGLCDDETVKFEDLSQTEVTRHPRRS